MRFFILSILLFCFGFVSFAQGSKEYIEHIVQKGETLFSLSRKYGVGLKDIKKESVGHSVRLGEKILIPNVSKSIQRNDLDVKKEIKADQKEHIVKQGETLFSISRMYGLKMMELKKWNGLDSTGLAIGQKIIVSQAKQLEKGADVPSVVYHEVEQSETLYSISKKYGTSVDQIKSWNQLKGNVLSLGQKIIIGKDKTIGSTSMKESVNHYSNKSYDVKGLAILDKAAYMDKPYCFATHSSIAVGTVIKVINLSNSLYRYVRVVKNSLGTAATQLNLNKEAFSQLGGEEGVSLQVKMVYAM